MGVFRRPPSPGRAVRPGADPHGGHPVHTYEHLKKGLEVFADLAKRYPIPRIEGGQLPVADRMDLTYLMGTPAQPPHQSPRAAVHLFCSQTSVPGHCFTE